MYRTYGSSISVARALRDPLYKVNRFDVPGRTNVNVYTHVSPSEEKLVGTQKVEGPFLLPGATANSHLPLSSFVHQIVDEYLWELDLYQSGSFDAKNNQNAVDTDSPLQYNPIHNETIYLGGNLTLCCDRLEDNCICPNPITAQDAANVLEHDITLDLYASDTCKDCTFHYSLSCTPLRSWFINYVEDMDNPALRDPQLKLCTSFTSVL